jgi:phosphosulfolactate synthase
MERVVAFAESLHALTDLLGARRTRKPRAHGITMMLDKGIGLRGIEDIAEVGGDWIDCAKIAWGSALITQNLEAKIQAYRRVGIEPLFGGTLFEYAYLRNGVSKLLDFIRDVKVHIEISDGVAEVPRKEKLAWIEKFARHVEVYSEIGRKTGKEDDDWGVMIREDLAAGAKRIVIEGREIGPVGQEIRTDLVDELEKVAKTEQLIFEALERKQQVWLIQRFGPNVNLGNILPVDVLTLESFRQGLKEHTLLSSRRGSDAEGTHSRA